MLAALLTNLQTRQPPTTVRRDLGGSESHVTPQNVVLEYQRVAFRDDEDILDVLAAFMQIKDIT